MINNDTISTQVIEKTPSSPTPTSSTIPAEQDTSTDQPPPLPSTDATPTAQPPPVPVESTSTEEPLISTDATPAEEPPASADATPGEAPPALTDSTLNEPPSAPADSSPTQPPPAVTDTTSTQPPTAVTNTQASSAPKLKGGKARRARPRRRVADSDSESGDAAGEDSLTEHSSDSEAEAESDDEDADEHAVEEAVGADQETPASVFVDAASTTPAAWDDTATKPADEVSFNDFSRGVAPTRRGKASARGGGVPATDKPKREYTEAETKRFEERKAKMKEKQKAKRAELKEQKRKEKEAATNGAPKAESSAPVETPKELSIKGKAAKSKSKKSRDAHQQESTLVASTSALKIDDTPSISDPPAEVSSLVGTELLPDSADTVPTSAHPSRNQATREAYTERVANDPKFTPRVGGFWTHDQRHYDAGKVGEGGYTGLRNMSEYWRGRGGPRGGPRGGFRGRGRGFGPAGFGQHPLGQGTELTDPEPETGGSKLAMDREIELEEARKVARQRAIEQQAQQTEQVDSESQAESVEPAPVPPASFAERKWGHEAFESIQAVQQFQAARGRGRGRGRGALFPRGGFVPRGNAPRPFSPHASAQPFVPTAIAQPIKLPDHSTTPPSGLTENSATQPTADELLPEAEHLVKVRLPGLEMASHLPLSPEPPRPAETTPNGATVLYRTPAQPAEESSVRLAQPAASSSNGHLAISRLNGSSPAPFINGHIAELAQASPQFASITGSENGSISSAGHVPPQAYLPPGIGVTSSGEYFNVANGAPVNFRPAQPPAAQTARPYYPRAYPSQQQPQFYPQQSYSPDPFNPTQQHAHRASISSNGPIQSPQGVYMNDGRGSPFGNPYSAAGMAMAVPFVPARSSMKITIRKPDTATSDAGSAAVEGDASSAYAGFENEAQQQQQQQQQHQQQQQQYFAQHYNPYAAFDGQQGQVQGQDGVYYGDGYGWQAAQQGQHGYGETGVGYGYEGGYPGF